MDSSDSHLTGIISLVIVEGVPYYLQLVYDKNLGMNKLLDKNKYPKVFF